MPAGRVTILISALLVGEISSMALAEDRVSVDPASMALVNVARADLAQRLSVNQDTIVLAAFSMVVWPDAGMGCPRPGMIYAQVQRDGYRIELEVDDRRYWYHGGAGRAPFLCENPSQNPRVGKPPDPRV